MNKKKTHRALRGSNIQIIWCTKAVTFRSTPALHQTNLAIGALWCLSCICVSSIYTQSVRLKWKTNTNMHHLVPSTAPRIRFKLTFAVRSRSVASLTESKKVPSDATKRTRRSTGFPPLLHMWKHLLLNIWKMPAARQKKVRLLQISKLFMQNSSCPINCVQTSMSEV